MRQLKIIESFRFLFPRAVGVSGNRNVKKGLAKGQDELC